jgi:hypothetical protein
MTDLTVGKRLRSSRCGTEVIVIRAPHATVELCCGDHPMTAADGAPATTPAVPAAEQATVLGKRYVDDETGLEVLCTKPGPGALVADGRRLALKAARALPASD